MFTPKDFTERTWLNEIPFTDNVIESPRAASFCREAITMKSVFKTFSVNLFAQSHLNILLSSICILFSTNSKLQPVEVIFVSSANSLAIP